MLGSVCKQLDNIAKTYNNWKFIISFALRYNSSQFLALVQLQNVTSITLNEAFHRLLLRSLDLDFIFSDIFKFTRLKSLSLLEIDNLDLDTLLEQIGNSSLIALRIHFRDNQTEDNRRKELLSSAIIKSELKKLDVNNIKYVIESLQSSIPTALNRLTIKTCTYNEYCKILYTWPSLRAFIMNDCIMSVDNDRLIPHSTDFNRPQLAFLTINDCHLKETNLRSMLSLTPCLTYLKLICLQHHGILGSSGYQWENFIQEKLPLLSDFKFYFAYTYSNNYDYCSLESIIACFRTQFWLKTKHWFVAIDYHFVSSRFTVYTVPICIFKYEIATGCTILSTNNICRLINHSENNRFEDDMETEVCN